MCQGGYHRGEPGNVRKRGMGAGLLGSAHSIMRLFTGRLIVIDEVDDAAGVPKEGVGRIPFLGF
jgi:hypothetical protein